MKIFYGVQGTGNGHITRARVMARELYAAGHEVDFLFTGRSPDKFFDMQIFHHCQFREGLTFNTDKGRVNYIKTILQVHPIQFINDVKSLPLSDYDLIISDFEPVTAWAAKYHGLPIMTLGHQYAFKHDIPKARADPLAHLVMQYFAPAETQIGLHWHHFNQPILPPIIETPEPPRQVQQNKIIVYLPFEDQRKVVQLLSPFQDFDFYLYTSESIPSRQRHIIINPLSRENFQRDLYDSVGIISNAGFELASESLQLGKKILAKPLQMQMEQLSNALALEELGYGRVVQELDRDSIASWLQDDHAVRITYPNVAKAIVQWLDYGMPEIGPSWTERIWSRVTVQHCQATHY